MIGAEAYWVGVLRGRMVTEEDPADRASIETLRRYRERVAAETVAWLRGASDDGVNWERVFADGLGNPRNTGVRSLLSTSDGLLIGIANIDDGLSVWRFVP